MSKSKHIKVVVRTRPTSDFAQHIINFGQDQKSVNIHIPKSDGGYINNQQENWDFKFDKLLHNSSQEATFDECGNTVIKGLMDGYNGTLIAYGQTGAGKTFTMTGASENYKHRGLIPRAITNIFHEISERPSMAFTVRISYLEIYNEQMIDLLARSDDASKDNNMSVVEDKNGTSVKGLHLHIANNEEEALNLLFEGETNRTISEHQLNKNSTRSHCIFTVHLEMRSRVESTERVLYSKLNLVDLAGSERLSKTQTSGTTLKEAMYINRSLAFLEQVIIALSDKKRDHIPYRQCKLTNVLRDALGGNCNTLMIANIRTEKEHIEETISTLRFATRMMCVSNSPVVNVQFDPLALIKKYENEVKELKQELAMHDTLSNRSHVQYEPLTEAQKYELQRQVKAFLDSEEEELEIVNLRQIREIFSQFRNLYKQLEIDLDDSQRPTRNNHISTPSNANNASGNNASDKSAANNNDHGNQDNKDLSRDFKDDDGVGETEGSGFGIGLAPGGLKSSTKRASAKSVKKNQRFSEDLLGTSKKSVVNDRDDDDMDAELTRKETGTDLGFHRTESTYTYSGKPNDAGNHSRPRTVTSAPPSRSEEFESFKRGKGHEMNKILTENKATLRDKKKIAKDLAEQLNDTKTRMDELREKVDKKKHERTVTGATTNDDNMIIDEEEFVWLNQLKELKQTYRKTYDSLKQVRADMDYCNKLVDQCRQKLMTEFEQWYDNTYGPQLANDVNGQIEDVMDVGEKFEKLQLERMSQEDPDSIPFYNAKKNVYSKTKSSKLLNAH